MYIKAVSSFEISFQFLEMIIWNKLVSAKAEIVLFFISQPIIYNFKLNKKKYVVKLKFMEMIAAIEAVKLVQKHNYY